VGSGVQTPLGGQGDHFFKWHLGGKKEFPASRSVPALMVLNKNPKYVKFVR
jgi:hypothetical protein